MKPDWTPEQTATAMRMRQAELQYATIAARFNRTPHAVKRHLQYRLEQAPHP